MERRSFADLQAKLADQFRRIFPVAEAPRTVVVIPSLSMDPQVLAKVSGVHHYEERMFCLFMLLRFPAARVIYVTSELVSEPVIDYFLDLLPGIAHDEARRRISLFCCHDASALPLTQKILDRPRLLKRLAAAIGDVERAHMACFNVTTLERRLAVALGIPIYGCDPDLLWLGSKSGSRALFREAGLLIPDGIENLGDGAELAAALAELKRRDTGLARAVVKLNEGFSGEGNAVFSFAQAPEGPALVDWMRSRLPQMAFAAQGMGWEEYENKIAEMGAVAEAFIEGDGKRSPSSQYRINPLGEIEIVSTHEQILGGGDGQVFLGCRFPAEDDYRLTIQNDGAKVASLLAARGVLGRFGIDYVSVRGPHGWTHYAIEINLRKGGTTHPFMMLHYLTGGHYDAGTGLFVAPDGSPRFYRASDNIVSERYRGLTPQDLFDIARAHGIHFDNETGEGVVFHLIGALSQFGKIGAVCVGRSREDADRYYAQTIAMLDAEAVSADGA